mgnify:CR=1 FL=1
MLFHEIYGCYYESVARIIDQAIKGTLNEKIMHSIIQETAFSESFLTIEPALKNHQWPLLCDDMHTPVKHPSTMPLTLIEKRWLKAILLDPRIQLFDVSIKAWMILCHFIKWMTLSILISTMIMMITLIPLILKTLRQFAKPCMINPLYPSIL